jgi:50S ribosomal protein L16 3-hydroxylase
METTTPGLAALLAPFSSEQFLTEHWPEQPLHVPSDDPERFVKLLGVPELRDFRSLERVWAHEAFVLPPRGGDEYQGVEVHGPAIRRLFEAGIPMFLHKPDRQFPQLRVWMDQLRLDLGIPARGLFLSSTHTTMGNTTTHTHFDHAATFVLQMSGVKKWWVAPNRSVPLPTSRHSLAMERIRGELANYQEAPIPSGMPDDAVVHTLAPGSLLFVPNGWWHATEALGESLALMFIMININWADVVCHALRKRLIQDPAWRRFAVGAGSPNPRFRAGARAELGGLLERFRESVAALGTDEVLLPRFMRSAEVGCALTGHVAVFTSRRWESRIEFGPEELEIFHDIERRDREFTAEELIAHGFDKQRVHGLLAALLDIDYLLVE